MRTTAVAAWLVAACAVGCGPKPDSGPSASPSVMLGGYELSLSAGAHDSGARRAVALLATARDSDGRGPSDPWSFRVTSPSGAETSETYSDSSVGSFVAWWWDSLPVETGTFTLEVRAPTGSRSFPFEVEPYSTLDAPAVSLSVDGQTLVWPAIEAARSYSCQFERGGALVASTAPGADPTCALSALEDGAYVAHVLAYTADFDALSKDASRAPALPERFDITEAQLGLARGATSSIQLKALAGPLNYGTVIPGIALWISLVDQGGAPVTESWPVTVTGPSGATLSFTYPANAAHFVVWDYDREARAGVWTVEAKNASATLATTASIGDVEPLPLPSSTAVAPSASGSAEVTWMPVPGAQSYRVSVWAPGAAEANAIIWTRSASAKFEAGAFAAGSYDAYVTAVSIDVDAPLSAQTAQGFRASENAYSPTSFQIP